MTQAHTAIFHKIHSFFCLQILVIAASFLSGCKEVLSYSSSCKDFNGEYLAKLSKKNDIDSARELTTLYVECNGNQDQKIYRACS